MKSIYILCLFLLPLSTKAQVVDTFDFDILLSRYLVIAEECLGPYKQHGYTRIQMFNQQIKSMEWDVGQQVIALTWEKEGVQYIRSIFKDNGNLGAFFYPENGLTRYFNNDPNASKYINAVFIDIMRALKEAGCNVGCE